jgi:hypothetical protein
MLSKVYVHIHYLGLRFANLVNRHEQKKLAKPFTENRQQGPQNATVYTRGW